MSFLQLLYWPGRTNTKCPTCHKTRLTLVFNDSPIDIWELIKILKNSKVIPTTQYDNKIYWQCNDCGKFGKLVVNHIKHGIINEHFDSNSIVEVESLNN